MAIVEGWKKLQDVPAFCKLLGIAQGDWRQAVWESAFKYIERTQVEKSGKKRHLCYPPRKSVLRRVQNAIKIKVLVRLGLCSEVLGYVTESHNIKVAASISGFPFVGSVDVSSFHPSIKTGHVAAALVKHGLSWPWAREIARIVTFRGRLPQGAPTSNHIANIVMDSMMRRAIVPYARQRGVLVRNYGDDIAFAGKTPESVRECVSRAKSVIVHNGFATNEKSQLCQHRGERRVFIGCATGREQPDFPRDRYCELRREVRGLLHRERASTSDAAVVTEKKLRSLRHKIAYVARLNKRKARNLRSTFHRLCAAKTAKKLNEVIKVG